VIDDLEKPVTVLTIGLLALGGAIGSICRHVVSSWIQERQQTGFPWGTYVVNGTGSLLIGIVFATFDGGLFGDDALVFLVGGVFGGYTTFSTFSVDNMKLLEQQRYGNLLHNTAGQIAGGILFAALGYWLGSGLG
jgi:fluoride exporter